jgi:hypothetical protein
VKKTFPKLSQETIDASGIYDIMPGDLIVVSPTFLHDAYPLELGTHMATINPRILAAGDRFCVVTSNDSNRSPGGDISLGSTRVCVEGTEALGFFSNYDLITLLANGDIVHVVPGVRQSVRNLLTHCPVFKKDHQLANPSREVLYLVDSLLIRKEDADAI